jgi:hypothetical protein
LENISDGVQPFPNFEEYTKTLHSIAQQGASTSGFLELNDLKTVLESSKVMNRRMMITQRQPLRKPLPFHARLKGDQRKVESTSRLPMLILRSNVNHRKVQQRSDR